MVEREETPSPTRDHRLLLDALTQRMNQVLREHTEGIYERLENLENRHHNGRGDHNEERRRQNRREERDHERDRDENRGLERERREEIYRNNERLYEVYWERQKESWLKEKELEREKNRGLEQKKITEDEEKIEEKQLVGVVMKEKERKFEKIESDIVSISSENECQKEKIKIESEKKLKILCEKENESCKLRDKKEINEKVEGEKVELKEKEKSKERKNEKNNEEKNEIDRNIVLTPPNSFCASIVVPYMQEVDEDFPKRFLSRSPLVMKLPINFKGVQVLEWKGWKRLIFDPGIELTYCYFFMEEVKV